METGAHLVMGLWGCLTISPFETGIFDANSWVVPVSSDSTVLTGMGPRSVESVLPSYPLFIKDLLLVKMKAPKLEGAGRQTPQLIFRSFH